MSDFTERGITSAEWFLVETCLRLYREQLRAYSDSRFGMQLGQGLPSALLSAIAAVHTERQDPTLVAELERAEREAKAAAGRVAELRKRVNGE